MIGIDPRDLEARIVEAVRAGRPPGPDVRQDLEQARAATERANALQRVPPIAGPVSYARWFDELDRMLEAAHGGDRRSVEAVLRSRTGTDDRRSR